MNGVGGRLLRGVGGVKESKLGRKEKEAIGTIFPFEIMQNKDKILSLYLMHEGN